MALTSTVSHIQASLASREPTPQLVEALSHLTIEDQQRIAYRCHIPCGTHSKSQMIQAISHAFRRPDFLRSLMEQLSRDEKRVLDHLLWSPVAFHGFRDLAQDLDQRVLEGADWDRIQDILDSLTGFGLVVRQGESSDKGVLYIPSDIVESLNALLTERLGQLLPPEGETVKPLPFLPFSPLDNLFDLLCFIHKNEVRLTTDRRPFKRAADRIRETLAHPTGDIFLPFAKEPLALPDQWELLFDYALAADLVAEQNARLEVTPGMAQWLERPRAEMARLFLEYVRNRFIARDRVLSAIFAMLHKAPAREWQTWDGLGRLVTEEVLLTPPPQSHLAGALEWMSGLLYSMGLTERGNLSDGRTAYRRTALDLWMNGEAAEPPVMEEPFQIAVQPNFEALIPSASPFANRWRLEQFADLIRRDIVLTYRISRESVYLHFQRGGTLDEILSVLSPSQGRPMPQNLVFSLREWSDSYGAISFSDVVLLHCRTPHLSREIEATRTIAPHLRGRVSDTVLIVAREKVDEVRQELARLGYLPDPMIRSL